jgi:hypothetical protein
MGKIVPAAVLLNIRLEQSDEHSSLFHRNGFARLVDQSTNDPKFRVSNPGAYTIKLIAAVIYGFS